MLYEYLVTLDQEVRLFWARRARAASMLFFTIRYWTLLNYVVLWSLEVAAANFSDEVRARTYMHDVHTLTRDHRGASSRCCAPGIQSRRTYIHISQLRTQGKDTIRIHLAAVHTMGRYASTNASARSVLDIQYRPVLSALRVFALSGKHWPLSVLVFVVASAPAITNLVSRVPCPSPPGV